LAIFFSFFIEYTFLLLLSLPTNDIGSQLYKALGLYKDLLGSYVNHLSNEETTLSHVEDLLLSWFFRNSESKHDSARGTPWLLSPQK
jgi:hypothetical protein